MADNSAKIAELRAILDAGRTSESVDGVSASTDLAEVRRQLTYYLQTDDTYAATTRQKMVRYTGIGGTA